MRKQQWLDTAEKLKHVNPHVLQDMQDKIMLEGFSIKPEKVKQAIEEDRKRRIAEQMKLKGLDTEDAEHYDKVSQLQDKKRRFLTDLRPGKIWNFFEDCPEDEKIDHILRYNANPNASYVDGRIEEIMKNIDEISMNLQGHAEVVWKQLLTNTHGVFKEMYEKHKLALENAS